MKALFLFLTFVLAFYLWICCVFFTDSPTSRGFIGVAAFIVTCLFVLLGYVAYIEVKK